MALPILILYIWGTHRRNHVWGDEVRLFEDIALKSPLKSRPHINLGRAYVHHGRPDLALQEYQTAELVAMDEPEPQHSMGAVLASVNISDLLIHQNRWEDAHEILKEAWLKYPHFSGLALNLSLYYLTRTPPEPEKAEIFLSDAIAHIRDFPFAQWELGKLYFNRGIAYGLMGQCVKMKRDGWRAQRLDPDLSMKDIHCFERTP